MSDFPTAIAACGDLLLPYFEAVRTAYLEAEQKGKATGEFTFSAAGFSICVRSPQPAVLDAFTRAFNHLRTESDAKPDLTICVWERPAPPAPFRWFPADLPKEPSAEFSLDEPVAYPLPSSARIRANAQTAPHMLRMLDLDQNTGLFWIQDLARLPYWEVKAPFRHILSWWLSSRQRIYLHSGAVGNAEGGVLLAGRSGAGKSTSSLACLCGGMDYAADDYCVAVPGPTPYAYSLYNSAKVKAPSDLARFEHLSGLVQNSTRFDREQPFLFLYPQFAGRLSSGFPIRAILFPQVAHVSTPSLIPISPAAALVAIAPSTMSQMPDTARESLGLIRNLVESVPSYRFEVGPDLTQIPKAILSFLENV